MHALKRLGCFLALAMFAGASARAATWFTNAVGETLDEKWTHTDGWTWVDDHGTRTSWDEALTYTPANSYEVTKDMAVSTSVKFTVMDEADLKGAVADLDVVKGGLTVAQSENGDVAYYGIAQGANGKEWVPLTGTPSDGYVTVTVEFFTKGDGKFVNYKVGEELLALASDGATTDIPVVISTTTIASVEYLGKCDLKTLEGGAWSNPCAITLPSLPTGIAAYKAFDQGGNEINLLNPVARGTVLSFDDFKTTTTADKYYTAVLTGKTLTVDDDTTVDDWATYVAVAEKVKEAGKDYPSSITVDQTIIEARIASGAQGGADYLYTTQSNGQLGWVNYSLGIADNETIAPTNAPQTDATAVIVNFGIDVDDNANVKYMVGGVAAETPDIELGEKVRNTKVVDVSLVLTDEGNLDHTIKTVSVGVMETGKQGPETGKTFDIVAVPWESMGGGDVTVNNLLNTAYLHNGDTLYIWNQVAGFYDTYIWTVPEEGDPRWEPGTQTVRDSGAGTNVIQSKDPATKTIAKNTAIWIERDTTSRIVFAGIVTDKTEKYEATVAAGGEKEATWSLIANPSIKSFDLSTISGAVGDAIIVEDTADPREYTYQNGSWGYDKTTVTTELGQNKKEIRVRTTERCTNENTIPAGVGFWYVRAAGQEAFTITFGDNNASNQ